MAGKTFKDLTHFQKTVMVRHLAKIMQHAVLACGLPPDSTEAISSRNAAVHLEIRFREKYEYLKHDWDFVQWCEKLRFDLDAFVGRD